MSRVYNFSAGPAVLPEEVLREAAEELVDYKGCGMSVMEMSHRSAQYDQIHQEALSDLRELMAIPDNYKIIFVQGGDSLLFATTFMNLAPHKVADYIVTGNWSSKAFKEGQILGDAQIVATSKDRNFSYVPDCSDLPIRDEADFVYICENETVHGNKFPQLPNTKGHVLVADQSSMFLSEPVDVAKYGCIHAGVQKNVGPSGVQIVIVREDLVPDDLPGVPTMLRFKTHIDKDSLYNTPPCYGIYICGKVFKWIKALGGLEAMQQRNQAKAALLYDFLDSSELFKGTVEPGSRSLMNVPFVTDSDELNKKFIAEATAEGLVNLKGHRSVGGMRASIYNAMPIEGVEKLVTFMADFEKANK